jgi:hypothetical protein
MNRLHHFSKRIWKKRWQVALTVLFIVVEYFALTAVHKSGFLFDGFTSLNSPTSRPSNVTPLVVLEAPTAAKAAPSMAPFLVPVPELLVETSSSKAHVLDSTFMESTLTKGPAIQSYFLDSLVTESPIKPSIKANASESQVMEAPVSNLSVAFPTKKDCFISSYSNDGIGHQMEAKISCLATALILNRKDATQGRWTYIHQPVNESQHGQDPAVMEELFGFSKIMSNIYDPESMELSTRELAAWPPKPDEMIRIFNALCPRDNATTKKSIVLTADNCWDFFYSQNEPLPDEWNTHVVPLLRSTILQGSSYVQQENDYRQQTDALFPHKTERIPKRCFIVMHLRLGDSDERQMSGDWIHAVWQNLLAAQELLNQQMSKENETFTPVLTYQLAIHSDGSRDTVLDMLKFSNETVVFMEGYSTLNTIDEKEKTIVSLYCRNDKRATLMTTVYDMLTANIFVTSDSALSHTASLLRNATLDGPTVHPPTTGHEGREQLGTILGRFFLKKAENDTAMLLWSDHEWNAVNSSFWTNLFEVYFSPGVPADSQVQ